MHSFQRIFARFFVGPGNVSRARTPKGQREPFTYETLADLLTVEQTEGIQVLEDVLRHVPELIEDGVAQNVFILAAVPFLSSVFSVGN